MAYKNKVRPKVKSFSSKLGSFWNFFLFIPGGVIAFALLYIIYIAWSIYYHATQGQSIPAYGNFAIFLLFIPLGILLTSIATTILVFRNLKGYRLISKLGVLLVNLILLISPFFLLFVTYELKDQERQRKTEEYRNIIKIEDIKYQELDKNEDGKLDTIGLDLTISLNDNKPIENVLISANTSCVKLSEGPPPHIVNARIPTDSGGAKIILEPGRHAYFSELTFLEVETNNPQNHSYPDPSLLSINIYLLSRNIINPVITQEIEANIDPTLYERTFKTAGTSCPSIKY